LKYILGIDSGATSSEAAAFPLGSGEVITGKFPPVNISILGIDESSKRLTAIITSISKKTGKNSIVSVAAGISGARFEKDRKFLTRYIKENSGIKQVKVMPDTETAFASAFEPGEKNCGILIAGTGSVLHYIDRSGKVIKIGGWGRHIGDEGSGYWISREALYRVTAYYDGRQKGSISVLAGILKKQFCIDSTNIIKEIYHNNFEISKITYHVFRAAEKGDVISKEIIKAAAENLLNHFIPIKNRVCKIALMGSLFSEEKLLEKNLRKAAKVRFNKIQFIKPGVRPVWGAVKIALANSK
jgi:N-acetylglucosamine kinase-like BadF-type ATPase